MDYFGTTVSENLDVFQGNKQIYLSRASEWWKFVFKVLGRSGKIGTHWQMVTRTFFMDDILTTEVRYSQSHYCYCWCCCCHHHYCWFVVVVIVGLLFLLLCHPAGKILFLLTYSLALEWDFVYMPFQYWLRFELILYFVTYYKCEKTENFSHFKKTLFILSTTRASQKSCKDAGRCKSSEMLCYIVG